MIRRVFPLWTWGLIAGSLLIVGMTVTAIIVVYISETYFNSHLHNSCDALNYIIDNADLQNHAFKAAVTQWAVSDGCR